MRKRKMVLGFDADGVVINWVESYLEFLNRVLGTDVQYEDCKHFDLGRALELPVERMVELNEQFGREVGNDTLPPVEGAVDALIRLAKDYEIAIITSRRPELEDVTLRWFVEHFPQSVIPLGAIHFANGRGNPYGQAPGRFLKPQVAEWIEADYMVEDNPDELVGWGLGKTQTICFAQPWNQSLKTTHPYIPRLDWPEILNFFTAG